MNDFILYLFLLLLFFYLKDMWYHDDLHRYMHKLKIGTKMSHPW